MPHGHGVEGIPGRAEPQTPCVEELALWVGHHLDFPLAADMDDPAGCAVSDEPILSPSILASPFGFQDRRKYEIQALAQE